MSASGDKADIPDTLIKCPLMTQSGHSASRAIATKPASAGLTQSFGKPSVKPPRLAPSWHLNGFLPTR